VDELARLRAIAERVGVVAYIDKAGEAEVDLGLRRGQQPVIVMGNIRAPKFKVLEPVLCGDRQNVDGVIVAVILFACSDIANIFGGLSGLALNLVFSQRVLSKVTRSPSLQMKEECGDIEICSCSSQPMGT